LAGRPYKNRPTGCLWLSRVPAGYAGRGLLEQGRRRRRQNFLGCDVVHELACNTDSNCWHKLWDSCFNQGKYDRGSKKYQEIARKGDCNKIKGVTCFASCPDDLLVWVECAVTPTIISIMQRSRQ
jgi:hypothetical protein